MSNSPLEKMIKFVKPGMTVYYTDVCNNEDFEVVSVTDTHIELKDVTGEVFEYRIGHMQYGWNISRKDLEIIELSRCKEYRLWSDRSASFIDATHYTPDEAIKRADEIAAMHYHHLHAVRVEEFSLPRDAYLHGKQIYIIGQVTA